ncbi:MAG: antitoxin MazE family protein [Mycobacteriales bacterium]
MGADEPRTIPVRARVAAHRARLREQGLRPVQIWVPDVRAPEFAPAAHEQSAAIAAGERDADDQAFVDAISWDWAAGEEGNASSAAHE